MSFLIIGHVRSGSTLLYELIKEYLVYEGLITREKAIGEFLLDSPEIEVGETNNVLWSKETPLDNDTFRSLMSFAIPFEYRSMLLKRHIREGYLFKSIGIELIRDKELLHSIQDYYHDILFIRRRNVLEAVLSSLLAFEYGYFRNNKEKPDYRPFEANLNSVKWTLHTMSSQIQLMALLHKNTRNILNLEDVIADGPHTTLSKCGLQTSTNFHYEFPDKLKMAYPCDKKELITNFQEVKQLVEQFERQYIFSIHKERR